MKDSFLNRLAKYIIENSLLSNNVKVILPNKRASLFLKKELITLTNSNTFLPEFISIEDFSQQLAELQLLDGINLQFELYQAYKSIVDLDMQAPFDKFIQWAPMVLQDFNEIDSYLVDASKLFNNLSALKRIEQWSPNEEPTALSLNYLRFFEMLNKLYKVFYKRLIEKKQAYQGLIYREAVKNTSVFCDNFNGKLIFAGFNALNKAEEALIQEFLEQGKAEVFWDVDKSLIEAKHPSVKFITRYKESWPFYKSHPFKWETMAFDNPKKIQFIGATKQVSQLKVVGQLLEEIGSSDKSFSNTALVLGDENLLNVALESLPHNVERVNITMGYALQNIPLASLFSSLFKANNNALKYNKKIEFYYKDVENLLLHPYISKIVDTDNNDSKKWITLIHKKNLNFIDFKILESHEKGTISNIDFIFTPTGNDISKFLENAIKLITLLKEDISHSDLEKEYIHRFFNLFLELKTLETEYHFIKDLKTLQHFYNRILQTEKLFFRGEPLSGLQIMGLLETRTLDFENVIITSVNEGILPGGKTANSFLPFSIKKAFGMPTYQEKDNIFSYHFFRLIQRAKSVYLIYNTEVDDFGASEKSRFLTQLELLKPNEITHKTLVTKLDSRPILPNQIVVTENVREKLKGLAKKGLSPSALEKYIKNPLDFYYSKILKIREVTTLEETIAHNTFGTVIHDTLFDLYFPYLDKLLTQDIYTDISKEVNNTLIKNFNRHYINGNINTGKNKLFFEMALSYIIKLINQESKLVQQGKSIKIIALEKELEIIINVPEIPYPIKIKGIVDRIDTVDGKLRIIDYKTGVVDIARLKVSNFDVFFDNENHTKALQLFMYALMYAKTNTIKYDFEAGIISFKKLNNNVLKLNFKSTNSQVDCNITEERLNLFETALHQLLIAIFNADVFTEKLKKDEHN